MTTFSFFSSRILKISPYINFKKIFGRILAPPSGRRPGADAPPAPPPSLRHWKPSNCTKTIYSYSTRFKNVAFHALQVYDEGAPTTLFASGTPPS